MAKALGCRTVALTGSDDKVTACLEVFGYDAAINYKTVDDLPAALAAAPPGGVDCFFDNVGGAQFDAIVDRLNVCGRAGQSDYRGDLAEGLAAAPAALVRLLAGENTGKALVRVGAPA